jgi:hypothetical protein
MKKLWLCLILMWVSVSLFTADKKFEKKYNLKSIVDDQNGIIWYKHKQGTQGAVKIYPYIGKRMDSEQCFLRMVILFYGSENLFVNEYVFTVDDEEFVLKPRKTIETVEMRESRTRRDSSETGAESKGIVEVYDVAANPEEYEMMEKISHAKTVKLRYNGVKGFKKYAVHKETKKAMKDVLDAYKELTGSL